MRKYLFFIFSGLIFSQAQAQDSFMPWGAVSLDDLDMKVYPADSSASAVMLGSFCYINFAYTAGQGYQVIYKIHKRVKILKKDGFDWSTEYIPLYTNDNNQSSERINSLKGITYNLGADGSIQKTTIDEKSLFKETTRKHRGRYNETAKFTLPNVKEGSIIEYMYELESDFIVALRPWEFQANIPVRKSEFQVQMSPNLSYVFVIQTTLPFTVQPDLTKPITEFNMNNIGYRWVQENTPAFTDDDFIATRDDYISKIQFQLAQYVYPGNPVREIFSTWEKTMRQLWDEYNYGGFIKRKGATKDIVAGLIGSLATEKEKLMAIYNYVKSNYKTNPQTGLYATIGPKELVEKKKGYRHEINLLLINMLREAELEANPVLLSTRTNGRPYKNYPIIDKFNYTIAHVKIGEEEWLLDATNPLQPLGLLPYDLLNGEGLLMVKDGKEIQWVNLQNRFKSSSLFLIQGHLDQEGNLTGNQQFVLQGYLALRARQMFTRYEKENEADQEAASADLKELAPFKDSLTNLNEYEQPLKGKALLNTDEFSEKIGDRIYLKPLLNHALENNPFKAPTRNTLVDLAYPYEDFVSVSITIPDGYQVESLPQSTRLSWQDKAVRFDYLVNASGNTISISCRTFVNRAVFAALEYPSLRDTFAKMVAKQSEQIVLKKK
ncbi:MAG: DUF3857 and transglutaminase domain-containing protein [Bernardetiaceae bacterium]|nr:DUF3857 and transglutaminase domain-containing protein [Bernardetiaceae bacterium]